MTDLNLLGFKCYGDQVPTGYGVVDKETLAGAKYIGGVGWEREKNIGTLAVGFSEVARNSHQH